MSDPDPSMNPTSRTFMDLSKEPSVEAAKPSVGGHNALSPMDPENPQNWPLRRKVYASSVAATFTFAVYVSSIDCGELNCANKSVGLLVLQLTLPVSRVSCTNSKYPCKSPSWVSRYPSSAYSSLQSTLRTSVNDSGVFQSTSSAFLCSPSSR